MLCHDMPYHVISRCILLVFKYQFVFHVSNLEQSIRDMHFWSCSKGSVSSPQPFLLRRLRSYVHVSVFRALSSCLAQTTVMTRLPCACSGACWNSAHRKQNLCGVFLSFVWSLHEVLGSGIQRGIRGIVARERAKAFTGKAKAMERARVPRERARSRENGPNQRDPRNTERATKRVPMAGQGADESRKVEAERFQLA